MHNTVSGRALCALLLTGLLGMAASGPSRASVVVNFDGELLDYPCQLAPGSLQQEVTFMERPVKDFQVAPARSPVETFSIRLLNCNTSALWKVVRLKFSGVPESNMTGQADYFLKVSGGNAGKLAIGLLDTDGKSPLKLGEGHNGGQGSLTDGDDILLTFGAFVQATPDAVANKSVQPGQYASSTNFELVYE